LKQFYSRLIRETIAKILFVLRENVLSMEAGSQYNQQNISKSQL
jgi:hypothetical protein